MTVVYGMQMFVSDIYQSKKYMGRLSVPLKESILRFIGSGSRGDGAPSETLAPEPSCKD